MKLEVELEFRDYANIKEILRLFYSINSRKYMFEVNEEQVKFVIEYDGFLPEGIIEIICKGKIRKFKDIHNPPQQESYEENPSTQLSEIAVEQVITESKEQETSSDQASTEPEEQENSSDQASTEPETEETIEYFKKLNSRGRKAIISDVIDITSIKEFEFNKCRLNVLNLHEKGESFVDDLNNLSRMANVGIYENLFKNIVICSFLVNKIKWAEIYLKLDELKIYHNKMQIQKVVSRVNASGICKEFSFTGFLKEICKTAKLSYERDVDTIKLESSSINDNLTDSNDCLVENVQFNENNSIFAEYINLIDGLSDREKIDVILKKIDEYNSKSLLYEGYGKIIKDISYEAVKIDYLVEISDVLANCGYSSNKWNEYRVAYSAFIMKFLNKKGVKLKLIDFLKELRKIVRDSK